MRSRPGPTDTQRLVVRRYAPWRTAALRAGLAAIVLFALWGGFEWGRSRGGYDVAEAVLERRALQSQISDLKSRLAESEAKLVASDVARKVDREAYAQVGRSLADLQTRLGAQGQELAFYRSVIDPNEGITGMRIQRLKVLPATQPRHFRVRIVLVQAARQDASAVAAADFTVDGTLRGRAASLSLAAIGTSSRVLNFSFRYFQELEAEIELPPQFLPQTLQVEVRPSKGAAPIRQAYPWKLETN
jgi:hypothetical protein